jgi:hypothetical protein
MDLVAALAVGLVAALVAVGEDGDLMDILGGEFRDSLGRN